MSGWGLDGVEVRYGRRIALLDVRLDVPEAQVTAVVGGDGAGKTTLLRVLVGRVTPLAGRVRRPPRRDIGYLPAASGVYGDLTVDENIAFVGSAFGLRGRALRERVEPLLEQTGLLGARARLGAQLSGGMRQKLALVMAMLHRPRLLVLDEPTTGLDPVSRAELWRLVAREAGRGAAVVFTTTYLDEAERAASVLVLDRGRTVAAGPPVAVVATLPGVAAGGSR